MNKLFYIAIITFIITALGACGRMNTKKNAAAADSVTLAKLCSNDTMTYPLSGSNKCAVQASVFITYPDFFKSQQNTKRLQKLFSDVVLEIPGDSMPVEKAVVQYAKNSVSQFGDPGEMSADEDVEFDPNTSYNFNLITNITVKYNSKGIIVFCKEELTKRNGDLSKPVHNYYTFDLKTMTQVQISNLFNEENVSNVTELIKQQLMKQLKVSDEDELNDMGYFNLDNLLANNNFYLTDAGITWNYQPDEIAVYNIGETEVTVPYGELAQYVLPNSVIAKYMPKQN
ncbi:MAG: RsiV family protein [Muribaculaceae bacterium]|jgi:hypothetical protein|nr:RsiV family protein [Muribaculaceae bacterium]